MRLRARAAHLGVTLALLALAAIAAVAVVVPRSAGWHVLVVRSASMEPGLAVGSLAVVDPSLRPRPGDVVTFHQQSRLVTHRVVATRGDSAYLTKGDANEDVDPAPVGADDVVGVLRYSVPLVGSVLSAAETRPGYALLVLLPGLAFITAHILRIRAALRKAQLRKVTA